MKPSICSSDSPPVAVPIYNLGDIVRCMQGLPDAAGGKVARWTFGLVLTTYILVAMARMSHAPLWMDEVLAVTAARQTSLAGVWHVIWTGTDFSPPTYHFMLHVLPGLGAHTLAVSRLPSVIAALGAALCVLAIARRRFAAPVAVMAFAVTLAFPLFDYAVQARPYAPTIACLAAALAIWDTLPRDAAQRRVALFGLWGVLSCCVSLHFYGIVAVGTLALCELLWTISHRAARWPVWVVLAAVGPVFLAWLPLAAHLHTISAADQLGPAFYARPTLAGLYNTYVSLLLGKAPQALVLGGVMVGLTVATLCGSGASSSAPAAPRPADGADRNLGIIMIALAVIPLGAFALAVVATGSFVPRYAVGITLLPGLAMATIIAASPRAALVALIVVPFIEVALIGQITDHDQAPAIVSALEILNRSPDRTPVLMGDGLLYIGTVAAAPAHVRARLRYLAGPTDQPTPDPTNQNEVLRLATLDGQFRVTPFDRAMHARDGFYLLKTAPEQDDRAFVAALQHGATATLVTSFGVTQLYHVSPWPQ